MRKSARSLQPKYLARPVLRATMRPLGFSPLLWPRLVNEPVLSTGPGLRREAGSLAPLYLPFLAQCLVPRRLNKCLLMSR